MRILRFLAVLCCSLSGLLAYAQTVYFISPQGDNRYDGTCQHPFATLSHAVEQARKLDGHTTLFLREGTYRLDNTLVLTQADGDNYKSLT